ncbi:MAG: T9SS type A sorting domain-containing protein [Bacteroidales bacterium]
MTDVNDKVVSDGVQIFPNPSSGTFYLTISEQMPDGVVRIYNNQGSELRTIPFTGSEKNMTIDMDGFTEGIYFVRIEIPQGSVVKKLILK